MNDTRSESRKVWKMVSSLPRRTVQSANRHSVFWLQLPFVLLFITFIIIPILVAIGLSFTDFNSIEAPNFVGLDNYVTILTDDSTFMEFSLPNTIAFAVIVGAGGYILSFFMAWSLAQITRIPRTVMAVILYSPSMTSGVMLSTVWQVVFAGDKVGYLNAFLLKLDVIQKPILWLSDGTYLLPIMIAVSLWSSMGNVFLIPWTYLPEVGDWTALLHSLGFRTVAMALRDDSVRLDNPRLAAEEKLAIVMGTEGDGLASDTIASCDYTVKIPMYHGVDSLNVAAASAVAFYELGLPPLDETEN